MTGAVDDAQVLYEQVRNNLLTALNNLLTALHNILLTQVLYEQVYALLRRQEGADVDCARTLCNLGVRQLRGLGVSIVLWMREEESGREREVERG